jgi:DNA-binding response OmpR family regulator
VGFSSENRQTLDAISAHAGWRVQAVATAERAGKLLGAGPVPVMMADRDSGQVDWRSLLDVTLDLPNAPRLIVCSRLADERLWLEVLNRGGFDVVRTPFAARELRTVICHAWESWQAEGRHARACLPRTMGQV